MAELLHLALWAADLDRSVAFYRDGLGLAEARSVVRREDEENVYLADGTGREVQLKHEPHREVAASRAGFDHVAFATDDVDDAVERLETLGGECRRGPFEASGGDRRIAFVADPDGHTVELIEAGG